MTSRPNSIIESDNERARDPRARLRDATDQPSLSSRSLASPNFLLKIIPHVDGTPRICELVEYYLNDITVKGAWTGPAALDLRPHALAPVAELPVFEVFSGVHIIADLTLGLGKVAYDYLR
jgi:acetoacetate decarboxylase